MFLWQSVAWNFSHLPTSALSPGERLGLKPEKVIPAGLRLIGQVPVSPNHYWVAHTLLLTVVPGSDRLSRLQLSTNIHCILSRWLFCYLATIKVIARDFSKTSLWNRWLYISNTVFNHNFLYFFLVRGVHSCWYGRFLLYRLSRWSQGTPTWL